MSDDDDDRYPEYPGFKEGTTSREAAEKVAGGSGVGRATALAAIKAAMPSGLTADECAAVIHRRLSYTRPRVSELRKMKLIEPSGERRKNATGMSAIVWVVAETRTTE